jgi:1,2-diacylglycerol 3-alpha-glucosyltransferase
VTKVAIVVANYGPYHLARARALAHLEKLEVTFIELASSLDSHPWRSQSAESCISLRTLCRKPFEKCSYHEMAGELIHVLNDIGPEVVITTSFRPFIMLRAARWARSHDKRAIFFYETAPWDKRRYWPAEALKRVAISRYYSAAFVGGRIHREYLISLGFPEDCIWEPYDVVDNDFFAQGAKQARTNADQLRAELGLPERYFLYVGRFAPEKNLQRLLEAHELYLSRCANGWPLVIIGDGPQRVELERAVARKHSERVVLRSFQQARVLPTYYALAQCFILASTVDPWGLVVNEAMACGLPVLVSRLCGSGFDLVDEGQNGYRFDPYDTLALANLMSKISSLSSLEHRRMSIHSQKIVASFCPEVWATKLTECVEFTAHSKSSLNQKVRSARLSNL